MFVLYLALLGLLAFTLGAGRLGLWLRKHPSKANAEKSSRILHFLFFAGLGAPFLIILLYPGLTHLDELIGVKPLPFKPLFMITGIVLAIPGLYLLGISNKLVRTLGGGANAFRLTKQIVEKDIYKYTRNPMSLGYYLFALSVGFMSGLTLLTLGVLLGLIPSHIFFSNTLRNWSLNFVLVNPTSNTN
jgi:protein-S-isoprenylcysteine O-methyltransferase Ste14